ncbi:MAG: TonB-dependent receptor [Prevotellaceae bacterium]|jgi:outer membrane receptor protein involved in Fe transport|nr:TonB-dependent receptor [Prevotellaceae bacterium]
MRKRVLLLFLLAANAAYAQQRTESDSTNLLEEATVHAFKTIESAREQPASVSVLSGKSLENNGVDVPTKLSAIVPNFYMPEYGSKLTSAIYIRGVGSRMNDPAVGLYVDNIPFLDKSMYNFDYYALSRIEVLRGPQGSLYGRNSMGGIINLHTLSPLYYHGGSASVSYGNANTLCANITRSTKLSDRVGLLIGLNYVQSDGFFTNQYNGENTDEVKSRGVRVRLDWKISDRWLLNYSLSAEKSKQNGYPYGLVDADGNVGDIAYNDDMGYERQWLVNSLYWQYRGRGFSLAGAISYQYFDDDMTLDQDFTTENLFTISQRQRQNAYTQEVVVKAANERKYQWLFGTFGFYKSLKTDAPVLLKQDFFSSIFPPSAPVAVIEDCPTSGFYDTPSYGLSFFHQSTIRNFLAEGLSISAGLRYDYEKISIKHNTRAENLAMHISIPPAPPRPPIEMDTFVGVIIKGDDKQSFSQVSPKFSLNYDINRTDRVYASVSRGYRSGGYNIQLFSDLVSDALQEVAMSMQPGVQERDIDESMIAYKPEYSWNYEVGGRVCFMEDRLRFDASAFYIDSRNQQIAQFVPSGLGRVMRNAGHSESYGVELSAMAHFNGLSATLSYGYTHATFLKYTDSIRINGGVEPIDYEGKYVPFVPRHILSVRADYTFTFSNTWIDKLTIGAQYQGAGRIYFTEANDAKQNFYSLLNGDVTLEKSGFSLKLWMKNITDADYKLFYFKGLKNNAFAQKGNPLQPGATLRFSW